MTKRLTLQTLILSLAPALAWGGQPVDGIYRGTLGPSLAVTLSLGQSGEQVHGYYHYDKNGVDIRVSGQMDNAGKVSFEELGVLEVTGRWSGTFSGDRFVGEWRSADGRRTLPFALTAVPTATPPGQPTGKKVTFGAKVLELPTTRVAVPAATASKLLRQMSENGEISLSDDPELKAKADKDPARLFVGETLDLGDDRRGTMVVYPSGEEGACQAANCSIWIFRDQQEILHGLAGIGGYSVVDLKAHGLWGIALSQHSSAAESEYEIYGFDGRSYRLNTCITSTAKESKNGDITYSYREHTCPQ